jgi:hypothetical protein
MQPMLIFTHVMKQSEAKRLILDEWDRWVQRQPLDAGGVTGRESLKFFIELQDSKSPLLNFQTRGRDKWRTIHNWFVSEARIRH